MTEEKEQNRFLRVLFGKVCLGAMIIIAMGAWVAWQATRPVDLVLPTGNSVTFVWGTVGNHVTYKANESGTVYITGPNGNFSCEDRKVFRETKRGREEVSELPPEEQQIAVEGYRRLLQYLAEEANKEPPRPPRKAAFSFIYF